MKLEDIKKDLKESFKGREAWKSFNCILAFGIYTLFIFFATAGSKYFWQMITVVFIVLIIYGWYQEHYIRIKEKEDKSKKGFGGWLEHEHGLGEKFKPLIEDIQPISRLSETDLKAVDNYIDFISEQAKQQIKVGVRDEKPELEDKTPKQLLTYEEVKKKELEELEKITEEYKEKIKQDELINEMEVDEENDGE